MSNFMRSILAGGSSSTNFISVYIMVFPKVLKERVSIFLGLEGAPFVVEKFSC